MKAGREMAQKIIIGADHGGFILKERIKQFLEVQKYQVVDVGCTGNEAVDYPAYGRMVAEKIQQEQGSVGFLICGTGIGMSIVANKYQGIRAAVVNDVFSAKATKEHNNSNILCLGQRVIGEGLALMIVETWLKAEFIGGKHQQRLNQLTEIEKQELRK